MPQITIAPTFAAWQRAARDALRQQLPPEELHWQELASDAPALDLFDEVEPAAKPTTSADSFRVPKRFLDLARQVSLHRDESRWALLYRVLWRVTRGEPKLLEIVVDRDIADLLAMEKAIRHDIHKMRAFVRFREVEHSGEKWFVAWFEPQHHIVEYNARFFIDRFAAMRWSILTPDRCAHWDGRALSLTVGVPRSEAPDDDKIEALWLTYYSHIFNPARVKMHAMQSEMPKRYWKNLPEAAAIPSLLREAPKRMDAMMKKSLGQAETDDEK